MSAKKPKNRSHENQLLTDKDEHLGDSKNTLNTAKLKMGRPNKMIVL